MEFWRRGVAAGVAQTAGHGARASRGGGGAHGVGGVQTLGRDNAETAAARFAARNHARRRRATVEQLGVTLANGGESDGALRAYRRSKDICPCYTRTSLNVCPVYGSRSEHDKAVRSYPCVVAASNRPARRAGLNARRRRAT